MSEAVMEQEQAVSTPVEEPQAAPGGETEKPAEEVPAWKAALEVLDQVPPDELRKHPKFWGMLGSELENRRKAWEAESHTKAEAEAREKWESDLVEQAKTDPDAFAERFLQDHTSRKQQQEIANLRYSTQREIAQAVGRALRGMPEWEQLSDEDHQEFFKALAGKGEDEIVPTFTTKAVEALSQKQAKRMLSEWRAADLEKERAAIRAEEQAKLAAAGDRTDLGRARGNGQISDEPNWRTDPKAWDAWFARQHRTR